MTHVDRDETPRRASPAHGRILTRILAGLITVPAGCFGVWVTFGAIGYLALLVAFNWRDDGRAINPQDSSAAGLAMTSENIIAASLMLVAGLASLVVCKLTAQWAIDGPQAPTVAPTDKAKLDDDGSPRETST